MKQLAISEEQKLPIDAATQTFAFIARKGAGKTYAAGKLVELLMDAGVQVVVLDTVGNATAPSRRSGKAVANVSFPSRGPCERDGTATPVRSSPGPRSPVGRGSRG